MTDALFGVGLVVFFVYGSVTLLAITAIPAARQAAAVARAAARLLHRLIRRRDRR